MQKAIKDLTIGDHIGLVKPNGVGEVTEVGPFPIVETAGPGKVYAVEWRRLDNNEMGTGLASSEDIVEIIIETAPASDRT